MMYKPCSTCLIRFGKSYTSDCDETCEYANIFKKLKPFGTIDEIVNMLNGSSIPIALLTEENIENTFTVVNSVRAMMNKNKEV